MIVRELVTVLRLNVDESKLARFESHIDHAKKSLGEMKEIMMAGFAAGFFGEMILKTAEGFEKLNRQAVALGITTSGLGELKFISEASGGSFEGLTNSLFMMNKALGTANLQPDGPAAKALDRLGLTLNEIRSLTPDQQFKELAARIAEIPNPADRARTAMDLFGRGAKEILPMLAKGREGFQEFSNEYARFGKLTNVQKDDLERLAKAQNVLRLSFPKLTQAITASLAPAFEALAVIITRVIQAFTNLPDWMKSVISAFILLAATLPAVVIGLNGVKLLLPALSEAFALLNWEMLPIIALFAALFLILQDYYVFTRGGDSLFGRLFSGGKGFKEWIDDLGKVIQLIKDLFNAATAASAWEQLSAKFKRGVANVSSAVQSQFVTSAVRMGVNEQIRTDAQKIKEIQMHFHLNENGQRVATPQEQSQIDSIYAEMARLGKQLAAIDSSGIQVAH